MVVRWAESHVRTVRFLTAAAGATATAVGMASPLTESKSPSAATPDSATTSPSTTLLTVRLVVRRNARLGYVVAHST